MYKRQHLHSPKVTFFGILKSTVNSWLPVCGLKFILQLNCDVLVIRNVLIIFFTLMKYWLIHMYGTSNRAHFNWKWIKKTFSIMQYCFHIQHFTNNHLRTISRVVSYNICLAITFSQLCCTHSTTCRWEMKFQNLTHWGLCLNCTWAE